MIRSALGTVSAVAIVLVLGVRPAAQPQAFDVVVRGGTVYDGSGNPGRRADVGIRGDRIAAVGDLAAARAETSIDATNMAVAPGFINMLSWSTESLLVDGRSQGEVRQGVTTQIFGEGSSMGPLNDAMKRRMTEQMGDMKFEITWTTLAEYLAERRTARRLAERRFVPRRDDRPRACDRTRRPEADGRRARRDAGHRAPRDGGRRARHRLVADLCAGVLCHAPRS